MQARKIEESNLGKLEIHKNCGYNFENLYIILL